MDRRTVIRTIGAAGAASASGCLGLFGNETPPPRKSSVIEQVSVDGETFVVRLESDPWVMSRYEADETQNSLDGVGSLSPVGVASAKKGGIFGGLLGGGKKSSRGTTGRGTSSYFDAPRTRHNRAWFHGGDYADDWYEDHDDDVRRYPVTVSTLGIAYLGTEDAFEENKPGPGRVPWDERFANPKITVEHPVSRTGWYRVGAEIYGENTGVDFQWEAVDVKVETAAQNAFEVTRKWKVSPRI